MSEARALAAALEAEADRLRELARQVRALNATECDGAELSRGAACRLLTADAVAERTGLSRGRIYELARRGEAGAIRVGERGVRFSERGLAEWMRNGGSRVTQNPLSLSEQPDGSVR